MKKSMKALQSLVKAKKQALKRTDSPRARDEIRHRVNILAMCQVLRRKARSAA